jgi:hypothetical protein
VSGTVGLAAIRTGAISDFIHLGRRTIAGVLVTLDGDLRLRPPLVSSRAALDGPRQSRASAGQNDGSRRGSAVRHPAD